MPTKRKTAMKLTHRPCRECGCKNKPIISDCGYSSFNVGKAVCSHCGFTVNVSPCGCFPHDEILRKWNRKNTAASKRADALRAAAAKLDAKADKIEASNG